MDTTSKAKRKGGRVARPEVDLSDVVLQPEAVAAAVGRAMTEAQAVDFAMDMLTLGMQHLRRAGYTVTEA